MQRNDGSVELRSKILGGYWANKNLKSCLMTALQVFHDQ